ncbi:MAG: hypothetical protein GY696_39765 [Gammaproteobacteria bacterium]|nr:hypothetical protein [Gammaproteobacteria bacterium]
MLSVKCNLFKATFSSAEHLSEQLMTLVSGQREAILEGFATNTSMDVLKTNTKPLYNY